MIRAKQNRSGAGVAPRKLQYAHLTDDLAVVRLTAALEARLSPPRGAALLIEAPAQRLRCPALGSVTNERIRRRASDELLWRVTFAAPLELMRHPGAVFELTAEQLALVLPGASACTLAALSQPWDPAQRYDLVFAGWRRRLVAIGTTVAVAGANTVAPTGLALARAGSETVIKRDVPVQSCPQISSQSVTSQAAGGGTPAAGVRSCPDQSAQSPLPATPAQPASLSAPTPASGGAGLPGNVPVSPQPPATPSPSTFRAPPQSPAQASGLVHGGRPQPARQRHRRHSHPTKPVFTSSGGGGLSSIAPTPPVPLPTQPASVPDTPPAPSAPVSSSSYAGAPSGSDSTSIAVLQQLSGLYASTNQPPPFLVPIYKRAGAKFHVPWQILAAINSIETDYGRDLSTSSAGAIGWMQFMPETWSEWGIAAYGHHKPNPYNPADAIFTAARYLEASGARHNLRQAIFAYNHATWYVDAVLWRASEIKDPKTHRADFPIPLDGEYVDPFAGVRDIHWERTDQGVDAALPVGAPIVAPGKIKIIGVLPDWYAGQPYIWWELLSGPDAGKYQYVAEEIQNLARIGSILQPGKPIATYAPSGTGIEYGWSTASGETLAMATTGYIEGYATAAGKNMRKWLNALGANAGTGAGLSIGAGADPDDAQAALKQEADSLAHAITTPGYDYTGGHFTGDSS